MKAYIDFDRTICPNSDINISPTDDCKETLKVLRNKGYKIVIFSVRSNKSATFKVNGHEEMLMYLKQHNIEYDDIEYEKKHMDIIIDDKCAAIPKDSNGNVDWNEIKKVI